MFTLAVVVEAGADEAADMISSVDTREFMPYGRDYLCNYSNKIEPLVTALRDFSINGSTATVYGKAHFYYCLLYSTI